jgi:hypothetical protein
MHGYGSLSPVCAKFQTEAGLYPVEPFFSSRRWRAKTTVRHFSDKPLTSGKVEKFIQSFDILQKGLIEAIEKKTVPHNVGLQKLTNIQLAANKAAEQFSEKGDMIMAKRNYRNSRLHRGVRENQS